MLRRCKLTESHIRLNPYSKVIVFSSFVRFFLSQTLNYLQMKVNLARDVFSWEVGVNLQTMKGAERTVEFILLMHKQICKYQFSTGTFFDVISSGNIVSGLVRYTLHLVPSNLVILLQCNIGRFSQNPDKTEVAYGVASKTQRVTV